MADQRGGGIAWTDETWNPIRGCSRVSEGCRFCYAEGVAARFSGPGQAYAGLAKRTKDGPRWTGKIAVAQDHLYDPLRWKRPRRVFVNSMSDLFHERLDEVVIRHLFSIMATAHELNGHIFQVLTKRAERMRAIVSRMRWGVGWSLVGQQGDAHMLVKHAIDESEVPSVKGGKVLDERGAPKGIWLGVSVEDQQRADERIPLLLQTPAAVRYVSYEPALGQVDFERWLPVPCRVCRGNPASPPDEDCYGCNGAGREHVGDKLDWVIVGGESGPRARPFDLAWARSLIAQCRAAGTACFLKQLGADPRLDGAQFPAERRMGGWDRKGGDPYFWPEDLRVRQFPEVRHE